MGQKQLQRWHVMKMVEVGKITLKEASDNKSNSLHHTQSENNSLRYRCLSCPLSVPSPRCPLLLEQSIRRQIVFTSAVTSVPTDCVEEPFHAKIYFNFQYLEPRPKVANIVTQKFLTKILRFINM